MLNASVLLLNNNFEPIMTCSARRAIIMVWSGKAEVIEGSGMSVRSVSLSLDIPAIIRLLVYVKIARRWDVQLTKQNVLRRDHRVCQYCGRTEGPMTIDHIIPRSHGGRDTWKNLVCACSPCNNKKGDRTPLEAGMTLRSVPVKPNVKSFFILSKMPFHSSWRAYLNIG